MNRSCSVKSVLVAWLLMFISVPVSISTLIGSALAQKPVTQADPRISLQLIQSLQAQIAFYEALLTAQREDAAKLEADWAEYSKSLWQPPPPPQILPQTSEAK